MLVGTISFGFFSTAFEARLLSRSGSRLLLFAQAGEDGGFSSGLVGEGWNHPPIAFISPSFKMGATIGG